MSGTGVFASSASARTAASFMGSLICFALTSSAPRKMYGKPSTLLTWLGKSLLPVAMIRSFLLATATS